MVARGLGLWRSSLGGIVGYGTLTWVTPAWTVASRPGPIQASAQTMFPPFVDNKISEVHGFSPFAKDRAGFLRTTLGHGG